MGALPIALVYLAGIYADQCGSKSCDNDSIEREGDSRTWGGGLPPKGNVTGNGRLSAWLQGDPTRFRTVSYNRCGL